MEKIGRTPVVTSDARSVPLGDIADVSVRNMPEMVRNDNGERAGYIYIDLNDVTPTDYVEEAREFLSENPIVPAGYSMEWPGTYTYAEEATDRLRFIVPLTLVSCSLC
jgi:Cu(I)/Ag(I) efflux system membrane protein CusA/SilA